MAKVKGIYIGRRRLTDTKLAGTFLLGKKEIYFPNVKYCEIGREYFIEKKDGGHAISKYPEEVDKNLTVEETPLTKKWFADHIEAKNAAAYLRARQKLEKDERLNSVVNRLAGILEGMAYFQVQEVVNHCVNEAMKRMKKK